MSFEEFLKLAGYVGFGRHGGETAIVRWVLTHPAYLCFIACKQAPTLGACLQANEVCHKRLQQIDNFLRSIVRRNLMV